MGEEVELYLSVYEETKAKWEITPAWRVLLKSKRKNEMLRSWASLRGAGVRERRPDTSSALSRNIAGWDWPFISVVGGMAAVFVGIFALLIVDASKPHAWEKPLPAGIEQQGLGFYIQPGFMKRADATKLADAHDLCYRLPNTDGYHFKITEKPNGGIYIKCDQADN